MDQLLFLAGKAAHDLLDERLAGPFISAMIVPGIFQIDARHAMRVAAIAAVRVHVQ